jgi:flagellar biosynthetic protein FliR
MQSLLEEYVLSQIVLYMLVFCRVGTTVMIMPGVGDGFINPNVRLIFAVALSVVMAPVISPLIPTWDGNAASLVWMMVTEILIGFFIGTVAKIFMAALDTGGMLVSMNLGLGNAQVFNPQMASQGSIMGAFLSITGGVLLFSTNLHHMLIFGVVESYHTFPAGGDIPLVEGMASTIVQSVSKSFAIGFYMAVPFLVVSLFLYIAMGVLGRLMPQIQVFVLALPLQITLGLLTLLLCFSTMMLFWLNHYDEAIQMFFRKL